MTLSFSVDGGATWKTDYRGPSWPTSAGRYILRFTVKAGYRSPSIRVQLAGSDQKRDGVRKIIAFGAPTPQRGPTP